MTSCRVGVVTENIPPELLPLAVPIGDLIPRRGNPRLGNTEVIAESLQRNGQYRPIVVNKPTSEILAGNHTAAAARQLGWARIAVTFVDVDEDRAARIVLADNRTADLGTYDRGVLSDLLAGLDGDFIGTGYNTNDLVALIDRNNVEAPTEFPTYDDTADTDYRCPKCHYEWNGQPR